jgi:CheY-like chemotaxis protein
MIVEDDIFFALNLEADMHALGFETDLAANEYQASELAMNSRPDVVLMDINLEGGREGIEVARWLRTVCDAPIIFISGSTDRDTVERIRELVPDAPVLSKPVYGDRLAEAVAEVIQA